MKRIMFILYCYKARGDNLDCYLIEWRLRARHIHTCHPNGHQATTATNRRKLDRRQNVAERRYNRA